MISDLDGSKARAGAVADLVVCPACRSALDLAEQRIYCTNADCSRSDAGFPWVGDTPGLIDFDRSIVAEDALMATQGQSAVTRHGPLWRRLSQAAYSLSGIQGGLDGRATAFLDAVRQATGDVAVVLIVGGATMSAHSPFRTATGMRMIASDIYHSAMTDVLADGHFLPFRDATFDGVAVQAVLEHVLEPATVVSEIYRVLKPGGVVYAETSFLQQVHEGAFDFTRFTHSGHRWLFRDFDEVQSGAADGPGYVMVWSIRYLVRGLARTKLAGIAVAMALLWIRLFDKLTPEAFAVDDTSAVFFIGRKAGRPLEAKDMIAYYRGAGRR